jgi:rhodanese-related sulfurtransferase
MNPQEFQAYTSDSNVVLIDVRSLQEYASGHIESAINMNMYSSAFMDEIKGLDKTKKYALYCQSGGRSSMALQFMKSLGFAEVVHLDGGISAWQDAGPPITSEGDI